MFPFVTPRSPTKMGEYEETFKDAQDAMDWVMDYIRSVEEWKS
jgi:hypothetical protein